MKSKTQVEEHQHTSTDGIPFGKSHPIDAYHKKYITRVDHNITIFTKIAHIDTNTQSGIVLERKYRGYVQNDT